MIEMHFFQLLKHHLATGGIAISLKNHLFNIKNSTVFLLLCINAILNVLPLTEANGFDERADILFRSAELLVSAILNAIIVYKMSDLFKFIDSLADAVNES